MTSEYIKRAKRLHATLINQKNKRAQTKLMEGFIQLGERYFTKERFINPDVTTIGKLLVLTKTDFKQAYFDETNESLSDDNDEATFSDSYRHGGLVDVETLEVVDPGDIGINIKDDDHIFTWGLVNILPEILAGTQFVAINVDTEGGWDVTIPIP